MYRCPDLAALGEAELLESVPYGDYYCTEDTALALGLLAGQAVVAGLLALTETHEWEWSRRNGVRILGRFAEGAAGTTAQDLVLTTMADELLEVLGGLLDTEICAVVLHDVIWVLDSFFFPFFEMQEALESITSDPSFESATPRRPAGCISRAWRRSIPGSERSRRVY